MEFSFFQLKEVECFTRFESTLGRKYIFENQGEAKQNRNIHHILIISEQGSQRAGWKSENTFGYIVWVGYWLLYPVGYGCDF